LNERRRAAASKMRNADRGRAAGILVRPGRGRLLTSAQAGPGYNGCYRPLVVLVRGAFASLHRVAPSNVMQKF
jgi:hypothetical protein